MRTVKEEFIQHARVMGKKAAEKSRRQFTAKCKSHGIAKAKRPTVQRMASAGWVEVTGPAMRQIPLTAKNYDIAVFAGGPEGRDRLDAGILEHTLMQSGRPLFFAPDGEAKIPMKRIAVAWDASVEVIHALDAAELFFEGADTIHVLSAEEEYADTANPRELVDYLAWHGLSAEARVVKRPHETVASALLSAAETMEADLLVMGGYVHNRFLEAVFGGTTLHVMRKSHIPLLMMH